MLEIVYIAVLIRIPVNYKALMLKIAYTNKIIRLQSSYILSHTFTFIPHNPFGMVFANAAVSAAQKPCQPLRGQGIHSHSLKHAFIRSIGAKAYLCPYSGSATRKVVFPCRGVPLEKKGQAPNGPPLIRGKTKGQVWGQGPA